MKKRLIVVDCAYIPQLALLLCVDTYLSGSCLNIGELIYYHSVFYYPSFLSMYIDT